MEFSKNASLKINESIYLISKPVSKRQDFLPKMQLPIEVIHDKEFDEKMRHTWLSFSPMKLWYTLCYNGIEKVLRSTTYNIYYEMLPSLTGMCNLLQNDTVDIDVYLKCFLSIYLEESPKYDISTQNMIKVFQRCQKWLNHKIPQLQPNVSLCLSKNKTSVVQNDLTSSTSLLLLKIITATCNIFTVHDMFIFSVKAFSFVPNVLHLVFSSTDELLVLEITQEEINIITQNIDTFTALFYYKINTSEFEFTSWQHDKQTYERIENKILPVDTYILPLNHNLLSQNSTTYIVSDKEIINAVVRSRLRAEKHHGIILDDYTIEIIDSTKSNLWSKISEYFFWWFCNVQGIDKDFQVKQTINDTFRQWIVAISHIIFVGEWAKSYPILLPLKIIFYTGPENVILNEIYNDVLLPFGDKHGTKYIVNGIYSHGFIKADSECNWTKIHQNIILFLNLAHIYPEVMMWLLNENIKLNKKFVKSIHPLFSEGTLNILHSVYDSDTILTFISKLFPNIEQEAWARVQKHMSDIYPIFTKSHD